MRNKKIYINIQSQEGVCVCVLGVTRQEEVCVCVCIRGQQGRKVCVCVGGNKAGRCGGGGGGGVTILCLFLRFFY